MPFARDTHRWSESLRNAKSYSSENFIIGLPGLFTHIQIFNPLGAPVPVRVRLRSVHAILPVAVSASVRRHDVALTTAGPPAPFIIENLLGGGPSGVALMLGDTLGATAGALFWQVNAPANTPAVYPPEGREWGHDLLPGQGMLLQSVAGTTLICNWQWTEVPL